MLKVFTTNQISDQDKDDTGDLLFALQGANTYKPLAFHITSDNSAITSLDAVEYDKDRNEINRTALSTGIIDVDAVNNIYNVDSSILYATKLSNGIYRFEFANASLDEFTTEYFLVEEKTVKVRFDTNTVTWDTNIITFDQINATV